MKIIKNNKGVAVADVALAISIMTIFTGVVGSLFYQIAYNNVAVRMNAVASYYAIKVAEYVDEIPYNDVSDSLSSDIVERLNAKYSPEEILSDAFDIDIDVEKYSDENQDMQDIMKKVDINISYHILDDEKEFNLSKIKIKEM